MTRLISSPQQLATLLKTTRKARKLTQAAVAQRLGFSQNRLSELEADASALTVDRLLDLARHLGLEIVVQKAASEPGRQSSAASDSAW